MMKKRLAFEDLVMFKKAFDHQKKIGRKMSKEELAAFRCENTSVLDEIELVHKKVEYAIGVEDGVEIYINSRSLLSYIKPVEMPFAEKEGQPEIAGDYLPLKVHYLHSSLIEDVEWDEQGKSVVYSCPCGEIGCWPLNVRIEWGDKYVVWKDFSQGCRREWKYDGLKFIFDRRQYERQLKKLVRIYEMAQ